MQQLRQRGLSPAAAQMKAVLVESVQRAFQRILDN
jgi:hypothetical protein